MEKRKDTSFRILAEASKEVSVETLKYSLAECQAISLFHLRFQMQRGHGVEMTYGTHVERAWNSHWDYT